MSVRSYIERLRCKMCGTEVQLVEVASEHAAAYFSTPAGWLLHIEHDYDSGDLSEYGFCSADHLRAYDRRGAARSRLAELIEPPAGLRSIPRLPSQVMTGDAALDGALAEIRERGLVVRRAWGIAAAARARTAMVETFGVGWEDLIEERAMARLRAMEMAGEEI